MMISAIHVWKSQVFHILMQLRTDRFRFWKTSTLLKQLIRIWSQKFTTVGILYTKLYTSEYGNFIFQNVIYFFFDRRIIGQMRRNLEQAVSSLPNQWPPLTPCLSLQGSARSPTRPVPARPVTACLMMMLTTHCLPLQPNLGLIGKWFSVHSYSRWKVRGIFILVCIPASIWSFESLRPHI